MSRQLTSRPISQATINHILSHNPKVETSPPSPSCVTLPSVASQWMTLQHLDEFDSLQPEDNLKHFLAFARNVISRYEDDQRLQEELETETQDLLHYIELSPNMNACVYAKTCMKLRDVRRRRRACKNEIDLLKPLYEYLCDKTVMNQLAQIQGKCRTSKEAISRRRYTMRSDVTQ